MSGKEARKDEIVRLIEAADDQSLLETQELADRFGVSLMTVRRDLKELAQAGRLQRQYGGAASVPHPQDKQRREIGVMLISQTGKYSDPFFNALLEGVDLKLTELGHRIAYINTHNEVSTAAQMRDILRFNAVDGVILIGPPLGAESLDYLKANMRALVSTIDSIGDEYDTIVFDGYRGMRLMVDHLVNCGHRRLGFITGYADTRQQGFMDGLAAHGLSAEPELSVIMPREMDGWRPALGHLGAEKLMHLAEPPDAIVCASDLIAIGAIQWLHQHHLRVPEDIAVTGFDDIPESGFTIPSLTTIHVHKQLMGELAAERIIKRIENADEIPLFIRTPVQLIVRQSSG
ncbi:MAG: DeoR/GlpR family transcriptional regulator [Anaerolineae bacterium]|nr:DeoR/GlpR family transcriptional regulator [Anaerolineae bacterium]